MSEHNEKIQYSELRLPDQSPFNDYTCNSGNTLGQLSLINLFIGQNNTGKSRFLRSLFALQEIAYTTNEYDGNTFPDFLKEENSEFEAIFTGDIKRIGNVSKTAFKELLKLGDKFITSKNSIYKKICNYSAIFLKN